MKMKRKILSLVLASVATVVCAADRTWNGGGSAANWGTAANWGGTAPSTNDALFFGGTAKLVNTNDLSADTPFAGVMFNSGAGAFTLAGNRITLDGNITNLSASAQTLSLPVILSATRDYNASNGAITVNGSLSGVGGLNACGYKTLTLAASNTYDGVTTVTKGPLLITHGSALGSTNANTVIDNSARGLLQLSGNITVAEPLALTGDRPDYAATIYNASGSNTLSGPVSKTHGARLGNGSSGATLVIAGGFKQSSGGGDLVLNTGGGTILFSTTPLNIGGALYSDQSGLAAIAVAGNSWTSTRAAGGTVRADIANALPAASTLYVGVGYQPSGIFDLNRFDQTVSALATDTTNAGIRTVTSPARATLTVNQSATTTYNGLLAGAVCLVKAGTGSITFTNAISTTTGDIIVSNGTLVVEASAGFSASTNVVVAGGTLELRTATSLADSASLSILDGGAKLKIGTNLTENVNRLFLGGRPLARGTYGSSSSSADTRDDAHFSGSGKLLVLSNPLIIPTNYTWNAGGGADTYLSTAANWEGGTMPEFTGTSYVFFASSGGTATVNTNASLYGMTFNRAGNFTLANSGGALTLGMGGLAVASPPATTNVYTLAAPVNLGENQTWSVTNDASGTTLTVSGNISDGADTLGIMKLGNGTLVLSGSNTFDGVVSNWVGVITVSHPYALGSTAGGTIVNTATKARLELLGGITLAEPLSFVGNSNAGTCLLSLTGSNTVSGMITTSTCRFVANGGTVLNIAGGVTGLSNPQFVINAGGTVAFTTTPVNLGTGLFWTDSGGLTVLGVAGNTWGDTMVANGTLRTDVANAFPPTTTLQIGGISWAPNGIVNLNGFNQTIAGLKRYDINPGTLIVTSALPATLTVNLNATMTYDGQFAGALSLVKAGTGTLNLSNALSNTSGNITVSNGTLVVTAASNLGNSTNVTVALPVTGTSTLTLQTSTGIANTASLRILNGGTAKVSLASGVNETVGWLYFGDKMQRAGIYGSTSSSAAIKDDTHFAGAGMITVLHDKSGSLLRVQ